MNASLRTILAPTALLLLGTTNAQITIGPDDMPSAGDTVRYVSTAPEDVDISFTEAGAIWDMSLLIVGAEAADTCIEVSDTPFAYQLFFNNEFIYPDHHADYAVRGQSFGFQGQLTVEDVYDYFKNDDTGFRNVGFGARVNDIPTSVQREPVDWVHRFPMNYGDADSSFSIFSLEVPGLGSFTQEQWRYNSVDGWGTLYLPADTFEVLRVRSVLQRTDSVFIELFGQGFSFPEPEAVEYKWIAVGMDEPVLQVVTNDGTPTTARFYYNPTDFTTGIADREAEHPVLFPNPADDVVFVDLPAGWQGTLLVWDPTGRAVRSIAARNGRSIVELDGLAPGTYAVQLLDGPSDWNARFVVR